MLSITTRKVVAQVLGLAEMHPNTPDLGRLLTEGLSEERFHTEQTWNDVLAIIMAGRTGEEIVFGDVSTFGSCIAGSDLAVATAIASDLEFKVGFGEWGPVFLDGHDHGPKFSASTAGGTRRRIEAALARASALLLENVEELDRGDRGASANASRTSNLRLLN